MAVDVKVICKLWDIHFMAADVKEIGKLSSVPWKRKKKEKRYRLWDRRFIGEVKRNDRVSYFW